ncbi:hypothetical protein BV22DRAFT_1030181 [Leucogyrophana mollusca]|uniref:Uncharacterized protein n=1 Tax=Leucogyrophana mollusca TaxID=85980 RepID=A0ACB8BS87_9AGAM|nr:hypothetical protein BV22DRAFT_1030181 [Leucogyrophana mollusca]
MVSYARTLCALSLVATCSGGYTDRCNAPWVDGDWRFDIYGDYNCSAAHHHEWFRGEAFDWTNCFELSSKVPVVKSFTYYGHYAITIYKGERYHRAGGCVSLTAFVHGGGGQQATNAPERNSGTGLPIRLG